MGQDVRKILACNIAQLRKSRNLKKEALSLSLGFDNSYISKLEKESINITLDKLTKIADYFDIEVYKLLKK
ncbi:TPA: helix-turn-helix transcriptional regulator [Candidatus Spyradomonas excrementavium]|nr:helix-turn-helix transcriptional regulator [Candidatus Spyradomonas excrementavium]